MESIFSSTSRRCRWWRRSDGTCRAVFIYQAQAPEKLLYANRAVLDIFGCRDLEEFQSLTGYTFRGMLHPEDYEAITASINQQIEVSQDKLDYVEYRIIRKDGQVRWVDDYGHYTDTEAYGGIYYVFISDITEKREQMESVMALRRIGDLYRGGDRPVRRKFHPALYHAGHGHRHEPGVPAPDL